MLKKNNKKQTTTIVLLRECQYFVNAFNFQVKFIFLEKDLYFFSKVHVFYGFVQNNLTDFYSYFDSKAKNRRGSQKSTIRI